MLAPGTTVGRYVIKRKLAEGGMAELFVASAQGPEGFTKDVVLKVVRSFLASDPQFVEMFVAEARLASRLNHANIVQIFDFGKHEASYFLAMEYVRGTSLWVLRQRCKAQGLRISPLVIAEIGTQVARALHHAHTLVDRGTPLQVVHRDVTPQNVLLSFDGAVKLTDFGIAKASSSHTAPGMLKGKFAYMAPEQARGEAVDARTDLFALGIVMWEFLTGTRLFEMPNEVQSLRAVQDQLITPPHRLNPDVPEALSDIVMRALERDPAKRWPSAFELERALALFVLTTAKTPEDTSVARLVQSALREEYSATARLGTMTEIPTSEIVRRVEPEAAPANDALGFAPTLPLSRAVMPRARGTEPMPGPATRKDPGSTREPKETERLEPARASRAVRRPDTGRHRPATEPLERPAGRTEPLPPRDGPRPQVELPDVQTDPEARLATPLASSAIPAPRAAAFEADYDASPHTEQNLVPRAKGGRGLWAIIVLGVAVTAAGGWYVVGDRGVEASLRAPGHESPPSPQAELPVVAPPVPLPEVPAPPREDAGGPEDRAAGDADRAPDAAIADPTPGPGALPRAALDAGTVPRAERPTPAPRDGTSTPVARGPEPRGTLHVVARPYARVYVNDTLLKDVEGLADLPVRAGTLRIKLWHPQAQREVSVTVKPGETVNLEFDAMAAPAAAP